MKSSLPNPIQQSSPSGEFSDVPSSTADFAVLLFFLGCLISLTACSSPTATDDPVSETKPTQQTAEPAPEVDPEPDIAPEPDAVGEPDDAPSACDELQAKASADPLLPDLLDQYLSEGPRALLEDPQAHRFQLLVGEVVDIDDDTTCLVQHGFRVDAEYFYPASSIKTVASIAALQKLAQSADLDLDARLWFHNPDDFEELPDLIDDTGFEPEPFDTLRNIIDDTQIVSSNPGYNRLFDLAGHEALNRIGWQAGLESLRLRHRFFSDRTPTQEKWSPRISIEHETDRDGLSVLHEIVPPRQSELELSPVEVEGLMVGESYIESRQVIDEPMDFSSMNYLSLADHQRLMVAIFRPELDKRAHFQGLDDDHVELLRQSMLRDPEEFASHRGYNLGDGVERRFKAALPGISEVLSRESVRYYNKGGRAYGFHVENAYIVHEESQRALFVTAVAYVNENRRLNDDVYEYDEISFPFFHDLGQMIANEFL